MDYIPTVVPMPFKDGVRDIPEHLATVFRGLKLPTHELTYEQAVERMNWANARNFANDTMHRIQADHLRNFGR